MRFISTRTIALALAAGAVPFAALLPAAPVLAQDEEEEQPKVSDEFRAAFVPFQDAVVAKDYATAQTLMAAARAAAQSPYEKYIVAKYELEVGANTNNITLQQSAVDGIINSGLATEAELPGMYFYRGNFAYIDGEFATALPAFEEAMRRGYNQNNVVLMRADSLVRLNRTDEALGVIQSLIASHRAAGTPVPENVYNRSLSIANKAKKYDVLTTLLAERLGDYPTAENWRNANLIYLQTFQPDPQTTLDALRLMAATNSIQSRNEYLEWATTAQSAGLPGEAVRAYNAAVKANATSSSDAEFAAINRTNSAKAKAEQASLAKDATAAANAADGKLAKGTAEAYLGYGEYAKAAALYRIALQKGGVDVAETNTRLGIALLQSGDVAGAKAAFAAVNAGPRAPLARLWAAYANQATVATPAPTAPVAQPAGQ